MSVIEQILATELTPKNPVQPGTVWVHDNLGYIVVVRKISKGQQGDKVQFFYDDGSVDGKVLGSLRVSRFLKKYTKKKS